MDIDNNPYAPPKTPLIDEAELNTQTEQRGLRRLCFYIGAVPGLVFALAALAALLVGTATFNPLFVLWGIAGLVGYISGLIVIFRLPRLNRRQRKLLAVGVALGLLGLLPMLFVVFESWQVLLLFSGPTVSALLLLRMLIFKSTASLNPGD